jgi:hypothetical protein
MPGYFPLPKKINGNGYALPKNQPQREVLVKDYILV